MRTIRHHMGTRLAAVLLSLFLAAWTGVLSGCGAGEAGRTAPGGAVSRTADPEETARGTAGAGAVPEEKEGFEASSGESVKGRGAVEGEDSGDAAKASAVSSEKTAAEVQEEFLQLTDDFFMDLVSDNAIDLHYTLADPGAYGITEIPRDFGDLSLELMRQDYRDLNEVKGELAALDRGKLTDSQRVTYDVLVSYVETELSSQGLELYFQPVSSVIGLTNELPVLLAEYPFYTEEDVENYLELLSHIDEFYAQILTFERQKAKAGLFMADFAVRQVIESSEGYMRGPEGSFMAETFAARLEGLGLTQEEKEDYAERNKQMLTEHFIPAYQKLMGGLEALEGSGKDGGLCQYPQGKRYYEYLVKSNTGTSYKSVGSLRRAVTARMERDMRECRRLLEKNPELIEEYYEYEFSETDPGAILTSLQSQIKADFPEAPPASYEVKYVPESMESSLSPAFYLVPPIDRYQDNVIYINGMDTEENDLFTTLAHEGYPGHLYQTVYFTAQNDSDLRRALSFSGYTEGWATYVELYSYGLDNGLSPKMKKLLAANQALDLGIYAMTDLNVNYYGWTREEEAAFLDQYYGDSWWVSDQLYDAVVENPTNYLEYYVGFLEIENMKEEAQRRLGERFVLKDFHQFILDIGPAPFSVIRQYFSEWLSVREGGADQSGQGKGRAGDSQAGVPEAGSDHAEGAAA